MSAPPTALVTGAAGGIGAATVDLLCERGYNVVAVDAPGSIPGPRRPSTASELDAVVARHGNRAAGLAGDVRSSAVLKRAVDLALDRFGGLDVAVAAAAVIAGGELIWDTPEDQLDLLWQVDVLGVWRTAAAAVPAMLRQPDPSRCRFVAVASAAGHCGLHRLAGYSMVKHAVVGLMRGLAADLDGTGITACAVSPGSTDTPMLVATAELYGLPTTALTERQPVGVLRPSDMAEAIAYACSPAGRVLHGSVIHADGGLRP